VEWLRHSRADAIISSMTNDRKPKCPEQLIQAIEATPHASFDLILRVSEAGEAQKHLIEEAGFHVRRTLRLVPTFAVTGPGEAVFSLLSCSWLIAVEPDRPIRVL
jgi:hypothetical protein